MGHPCSADLGASSVRSVKRLKPGTWGWIGLTAYVAAWDALAPETLTGAFGRAVLHPRKRWQVIAAWGVTTAHLFHLLPKRFDPIYGFGCVLRVNRNASKAETKHKESVQAI